MDVFWSSQDKTTIEELGAQGFCVATVFNKRKQMRSAVCANMSGLIGNQVTFWDEIKTEVLEETNPDQALWDAEYVENVQEKKWPSVSSYANYGQYQSQYETWTPRKEEKAKKENKTVLTQGLEGIPYWAQLDAELLGITPEKYWEQANNGDYYTLMMMDEQLDKACQAKFKVSYHDWQKNNWRA
jgi:hypothetical protein